MYARAMSSRASTTVTTSSRPKTARDNIATQQATVDRIGKQVAAQQAAVDQAQAQLASAQAGATRNELELKRQRDLAARSYASQQTLEQAQANRDQAAAAVQAGQAALEAAQSPGRCAQGSAGRSAPYA